MEEEKVLMTVSNTCNGTGVRITCDNNEEMFFLCLALLQTIESYPAMKEIISYVRYKIDTDSEFKKLIDDSSVSSQDFNEILKNLK